MSSRQREQEKKGSADIKESTFFPDWDVFFFVAVVVVKCNESFSLKCCHKSVYLQKEKSSENIALFTHVKEHWQSVHFQSGPSTQSKILGCTQMSAEVCTRTLANMDGWRFSRHAYQSGPLQTYRRGKYELAFRTYGKSLVSTAKKRSKEQPTGTHALWNDLWLAEKCPSWSSFS